MAKVYSQYFAGKSVNVPHSDHRVSSDVKEREKNAVTFGADGYAEVSEVFAEALVEFYPRHIAIVPAPKSKAKSK